MFHEPFFGQVPFSIDLCYFARWLRDGSQRQTAPSQPPPDDKPGLVPQNFSKEHARARLLLDSAAPELRMF